jgi:hypothetical protein
VRSVELAPTLLPAGLDRRGRDVREGGAKPLFAGGVGVDGELAVAFLEALRVQLQEQRSRRFEQLVRDGDRDPAQLARAQRKALFSLSMNPSSGL